MLESRTESGLKWASRTMRLCVIKSTTSSFGFRLRVWDLGFVVWDLRFGVWNLGFGVRGLGSKVEDLGLRI